VNKWSYMTLYDISHSEDMEKPWPKKVIRNFGRENGNFVLEKRHSEILVCEFCFLSPKLGARSPPMYIT